jgi:hypothetical protein
MKNMIDHSKLCLSIGIFCAGIVCMPSSYKAQIATINIPNVNTTVMNNTPLLFGISYDSRSSMIGYNQYGPIGYHNANGTMIPGISAIFSDFPMSTLRYPANAVSYGFDWKKSVGPLGSRPSQDLLVAYGPAQPMNFGFDEFMSMTASYNVLPSDIQIMIPIYDSTSVGLTPTQMAGAIGNPASFNADWVEYCNSPDNGSNPGGGIDWAAQRAANGHPLPYGIKIWNIGNEPWATGEFGATAANCTSYLNYVTPIINAMLAIDSTLRITLPTTGVATNTTSWAYTILNSSLVTQNKIYGVSQHFFMNEYPVGPSVPAGVAAAKINLNALITVATTKNVKVLVGDYAHSIPAQGSTPAQQNIAMQWQGANLEADFLLMVSQMNVERTNFWAYGTPYSVWHPIRINSIGNYTLMPAAAIYKKLFPAFLNKSVSVTTSGPAGSDGNTYAIRSGAFVSTNQTSLNVVSVNRDKINTVPLQISGVNGYSLLNARLLTATALSSDSIVETIVSADMSGNFSLPPMSVLILEYSNTPTGIAKTSSSDQNLTIYPNPTDNSLYFSKELYGVKVYNAIGQEIICERESGRSISTQNLPNGVYFLHANNAVQQFIVKH